jgi:two-component system OmpR family response regulator
VTVQTKRVPGDINRLLIIDDEPGITQLIEGAARELGFQSMAIHDSLKFEKALAAIRPTAIFLDITMPRRDGVELIADLSARNYPGRIVIMSGHPLYLDLTSTIARMHGLRLAEPLAKPFRRQQILDILVDLAERPTD